MEFVGNDLSVLRPKVRALAAQQIPEGETIRFCLVGTGDQSIVALDDRLLVLKAGLMAGAAFGGRATAFYYADISDIQVNTGLKNGSIEIHTAGMGATKAGDFWSTDAKEDPWRLPNCIPISKAALPKYQPYLDDLRRWIRAAKEGASGAAASSNSAPDLAAQLAQLQELHANGVLSEDEFAAAKKRVIEK